MIAKVLVVFMAVTAMAQDTAPWNPSAADISAGNTQYVAYDDSTAWDDGAHCTGAFTPGARNLGQYIKENFPGVTSIGGYSCRQNTADSSKMSVHGTGRAIDIMIPTITVSGTSQANNAVGDLIASYLMRNAQYLGVQYFIWDRKQWTGSRASGSKIRDYTGPNPHIDHIHCEVTIAAGRDHGSLLQVSGTSAPPTTNDKACADRSGICKDVGACASTSTVVSGLCPSFGSSIKCCIPSASAPATTKAPTSAPPVATLANDAACANARGQCQDVSTCAAPKTVTSGLCPSFGATIKCCIPPAPTPAPTTRAPTAAPTNPPATSAPLPNDAACAAQSGQCQDVSTCASPKTVVSGLCPSFGATVKCCLPAPAPPSGAAITYKPSFTAPAGSATCKSKISGRSGYCVSVNTCSGATYNGLCSGSSKCCVAETTSVTYYPSVISASSFASLFTGISGARRDAMYPYFVDGLTTGKINSCYCRAAFIAQVSHESGGLLYFEEIASGEAYNNRMGNGPTEGPTYKGRGPIQLTGKNNYKAASSALGLGTALIDDPERVCMPSMGFKTTVWFWNNANLNSKCVNGGQQEFKEMSRTINGGYNGLEDRWARNVNARDKLGCPVPSGDVAWHAGF